MDRQNTVRKLKFFKEIIEKGEGLPEGIQSLMKENPDLIVFKDTFSVANEELIPLVEFYFESILNHLVLDTRGEAESSISSVRDQQKGKIGTFFLEETKSTSNHSDPIDGLEPLYEYLDTEERYRHLLQHLCKDVYVDNSRDLNITSSKEKNSHLIILHPSSFTIQGPQFILGGSNTLFEGTQIGRKKEIEKMESKLDQDQKKAAELEKAIELIQNKLSKLEEENLEVQNEENNKRTEISQLDREILHLESDIRHKNERCAQLEAELAEKKNGIEECKAELRRVEEALIKLTQSTSSDLSADNNQERLDSLYERQLKQRQSMERLQAEYLQLKNEVDLNSSSQQLKNAIESLQEEKKNLNTHLHAKYEEKEAFQKKLSSQEDSYYSEKGRVFELEKEVSSLRDQLYEKENQLNHFNEKVQSLKFDVQSVRERASIEFQTNIDDDHPDEEAPEYVIPIEELKIKREKAQQKIATFGEINPMAISAYNEIKERHEHISGERDDILEAKDSLEETISEIEMTATTKFTEALDGIRTNFRDVFQGLFSEDDDCDIVLYDDQDPLEASIEIVAKPKGKKPKSISQLSGGEKTLTAVSFLFALYLLKPAPFCIFDEVDAPLDDVNVLKFNKLIRKFSTQSQFIIITHNKLTMAEADILYGVYLKEKGASGVSAVDFRGFENIDYMEAMGKVG